MKRLSSFFLFSLISIIHSISYSQYDSLSYFDPELFNGRRYSFNLSYRIQGHPFLSSPDYEPGQVIIRGRKFDGVLLNYDIYNQELVLKYMILHDSYDFMIISKAWLDEFHIHEKKFELMGTGEGQKRFFQVIGRDTLKVLYFWKKELDLSRLSGNTDYSMSEPVKTMYLYTGEELYKFRNNRNLVNFFPPEKRERIIQYLKQNSINVRNATDESMLDLLKHACQIDN
jgi:hypothetical protein